MLRSGSSGVTGGSLCNEMRMPVATAEPHGIQRDPCSGAEQPVDDDVAPVVDLVDEDAAGDAEIGGALQLFVPDRADVLEPQPVVGARVLAQRLFVDVEDGVDALVALDVTGHLPAQREVRLDDLGELFAGVVGVPARPRHHADSTGGVGVQVRERTGRCCRSTASRRPRS